MRSHSQKITVERLSKALARRGVTLKRHQLIEVLAETFGLVDSNDLAAAAKRGEIDPPTAEALGTTTAMHPTLGSVPLMLLRDPSQDRLFALDVATVESKAKSDRFAVTPYGGLVALPDTEGSVQAYTPTYSPFMPSRAETPVLSDEDKALAVEALSLFSRPDGEPMPSSTEATAPVDGNYLSGDHRAIAEEAVRMAYDENSPMPSRYISPRLVDGRLVEDQRRITVVDMLDRTPVEFRPYQHLMSVESFDTGTGPVLYLTPRTMAFVDGEPFLGFVFDEEYTDHLQAKLILRDLCYFRDARVRAITRVGGILRWNDNDAVGRFDVEILLPAYLADTVDSNHDWWDAVLALINSPEVDSCDAVIHPEAWQNDRAIGVDAPGQKDFDVAFEVLTMGREAAMALTDNSDASDELRTAAKAHGWIHDWNGPFRIEIEDEIGRFFEDRGDDATDISVSVATVGLLDILKKAERENRGEVSRFARMLNAGDETVTEVVEWAIDELTSKVSATAANQVGDDEAEAVIQAAEAWITENVSNAGAKTRIAAVFHGYGRDEAVRLLSAGGTSSGGATGTGVVEPRPGTAATMPDGETTIVVDRVVAPADEGRWTVTDRYGEEHVVEFSDGSWDVIVRAI